MKNKIILVTSAVILFATAGFGLLKANETEKASKAIFVCDVTKDCPTNEKGCCPIAPGCCDGK